MTSDSPLQGGAAVSSSELVLLRLRESCRRLQSQFETGRISKRLVIRKLMDLETEAYKSDPDAEPDGEITYCVASTVDAIEMAQ